VATVLSSEVEGDETAVDSSSAEGGVVGKPVTHGGDG
jgi:hypothetical protein